MFTVLVKHGGAVCCFIVSRPRNNGFAALVSVISIPIDPEAIENTYDKVLLPAWVQSVTYQLPVCQPGPTEYDASGVTYLTPDDQDALPYRIANILPWNHFGRKNVGYLYAVHHGAKVS